MGLALFYLYQQNQRLQKQLERIDSTTEHLFHQVEAYHYIRDRLQLKNGLPYTPFWSAGPDFLKLICDHTLHKKPTTIVECSSGLTSLVLARCCEINKTGKVYSLEHESSFAEASREHLQRYHLDQYGEIINAPLTPQEVNDTTYSWYTLASLPVDSIDLLVIDGPPGYLQKLSRFPALPLLYSRLSNECTIYMDDAAREDEQEIISLWKQAFPDIRTEYVNTERGCAVIYLNKLARNQPVDDAL